MAVNMDDLRSAGLLEGMDMPHLTMKGRDWLRLMEDVETQEVADASEQAADFVLSTNGLFR